MLLAIDAGNTQTAIGLFTSPLAGDRAALAPSDRAASAPSDRATPAHHWRTATNANHTADEWALMVSQLLGLSALGLGDVDGIAISSTVPRALAALRAMVATWLTVPCVVVEPGVRTGMPILYDNPREVGADRIANAVAAYQLYAGPTIVVDFGTATTVDVVSDQGEYLGGAIAPGIEISLDALFARAAALPRVELVEPRSVIGKSTVESIQSGAIYGYAAQADGLCRQVADQVGRSTVVATGGLAEAMIPHLSVGAHHQPWLTLYGLALIYQRNLESGRER